MANTYRGTATNVRSRLPKIVELLKRRYNWLLLSIIGVAGIEFLLLPEFHSSEAAVTNRYILSAISQGIAALFALVFTITLIVLQVAHKHEGVLEEFLMDWFNLVFPVMCGVGVIFPLLVMRLDSPTYLTNAAIALASLCVFSIVPFFLRVKEFLKWNIGIRESLTRTMEYLNQRDIVRFNTEIEMILNLSQRELHHRNYVVASIVLRELPNLIECSYNTESSLAHSSDYYTRNRFEGTTERILLESSLLVGAAAKTSVMKDRWYVLYALGHILDLMPHLGGRTFHIVYTSLVDTVHLSQDETIRAIACCSVWVLCATWLTIHGDEEPEIKSRLKGLAENEGYEFVMSCNDPNGAVTRYANAATVAKDKPRIAPVLEMLRSWLISVYSNDK